jgi:diguanylate cyclase (GGDEF)-like protein
MIDIDKLKQVNDRKGHAAGSAHIAGVGRVLGETIRPTDIAIRYGGDEFLVLLPHTAREEAIRFCERVLIRLRAADILVSMGLSTLTIVSDSLDDIFASADQAVYRAKRAGGNQLAVAD